MGNKVYVVGVGMTKFEKPGSRDWDYPDMALEAGTKALDDAGVKYEDVEQAIAAYCYGDSTSGQEAIYGLGLSGIPIVNVNNNCSTGSSALFLAKQLIAGGIVDCALAIGFEKMEKGSLGIKFPDRRPPMSRQLTEMIELRGFTASPPAAQVFGNADLGRFGCGRLGQRTVRAEPGSRSPRGRDRRAGDDDGRHRNVRGQELHQPRRRRHDAPRRRRTRNPAWVPKTST